MQMFATLIKNAVVFGLLSVGVVVGIYGTVSRNRWGINLGDVVCPRCGTPLPKVREPRSLRQEIWGGWTCARCGTEVDKWGREVRGRVERGFMGETRAEGERADGRVRTMLMERFRGRSALFWATILPLAAVYVGYDFYHPGAIVFDVIAGVVLLGWYYRSRRG